MSLPTEVTPGVEEKERFTQALIATADMKYGELLGNKPTDKRYLEYPDAQAISMYVKAVFKNVLPAVPKQVDGLLLLCEAILAPSRLERIKLIKASVGIAGGATGIGLIVSSVLTAMGVGAATPGVATAVWVWVAGTAATGPVGWVVGGIAAGAAIAAISGYFALTGSPLKNTERYHKALTEGLKKAVDAIWLEHGERLAAAPVREAKG